MIQAWSNTGRAGSTAEFIIGRQQRWTELGDDSPDTTATTSNNDRQRAHVDADRMLSIGPYGPIR
jgi:hypothetical protein